MVSMRTPILLTDEKKLLETPSHGLQATVPSLDFDRPNRDMAETPYKLTSTLPSLPGPPLPLRVGRR
jgi:hypothetical protein